MRSSSILEHTPALTIEAAARLAREIWNLDGRVTALPGERDQNFLLEIAGGARYVLKIANALDTPALHEATIQAMERVVERAGVTSLDVRSRDGDAIVHLTDAGRTHVARIVTWVDGSPLAGVKTRTRALLEDVGTRIGAMHAALDGFDHAALHRSLDWDMARAGAVVGQLADRITDADLRNLVRHIAEWYDQSVNPVLPSLRSGIIHGDVNDHNILVSDADRRTGERVVTGIIDFGDMHYGCMVGDLAIAIAYLMLDAPDPLHTAASVIAGFHAERPLTTDEIDVLFPMALMRLCVSVCMAAKQQAERPDDEYLGISQAHIRRTLPRLAAIHTALATAHFRAACRLEPVPGSSRIQAWIDENCVAFGDVLDEPVSAGNSVVFDLDLASPLVSGDPALNEEPVVTGRLAECMRDEGAKYGIARFDEARLLNSGVAYAGGPAGESRTVHLGVDLYAGEGAAVRTPLAGTIVAFNDNALPQDYGPVIIVEHRTDEGDVFHTLWGHLSRASLVGMFEGRELIRGERIGTIGGPHENGGWTPHVHVQIVVDTLGMGTGFPGICRASEREIWTSFSPDPRALLRIPPELFPDRPIPYGETLIERETHLAPALSLAYRQPVKVVRGWMQYMFDETGRRYIDAYNNVPHVGHCHPRVVAAAQRQVATLNTNTRYLHDAANQFAQRLAATLPDPLSVVCLVNSASEANELALRMARAHTGCTDTIVLEHAYHGNTTTLIDISPYKHDGPGGTGAPGWVHTATMPDVYRGEFRTGDREAAELYAADVRRIIEKMQAGDVSPAAFIAESCPSVGGQIMFPPGYLDAVYRHVREAGGVCIADDVQTGYGRIGTHFYAFEAQGVVPDIVVLGKPIGNGHPIGAVITTPEIAASFDNGMEFFSTFGGNTVSCAIGLAVLDVVEDEGLQGHALEVGRHLTDGLRDLAGRHPVIGDVRGSGLFLGVELVRDRETLEPAGDEAALTCDRMRERGILIGTDGPHHNVLKIRPPMTFAVEDAEALLATLDHVLVMD